MPSCFNYKTPSPSRTSSTSGIPARHSFSDSTMIDQTLETAASMILKWDSESSTYAKVTSLFYENKREAKKFIKCVNNLQQAMHTLFPQDSTSEKLIYAQSLMQMAMKRLQKEFYQILSMNRAFLDPESMSTRSSTSRASTRSSMSDFGDDDSSDHLNINEYTTISQVEDVSFMVMSDLRSIAECMISSGYSKECVDVYKVIRKSIIDEGIYRLGVEKLSSKVHKMDWEVVDEKIKNWLASTRVAINTLFTGERILCDHIFASLDSIRESCFSEISKEGATLLFSFPEIVTKCKKSEEKIFRLLDMYSAISENWPAIESIFSFESTSSIRMHAVNSMIKLGESVRELLSEFELSIQKDKSNPKKSPVPGGGVHPLTTKVLNYLSFLADYNANILTDIFSNRTFPDKKSFPEYDFVSEPDSDDQFSLHAVSQRIAWLILVLLCKLDEKARYYKEVSFSYLFLANNIQHVLARVCTSNLMNVLGENWIERHEKKVMQFATSYVKVAWGKVSESLDCDNPTAEKVEDRFRRFCSSFAEANRRQSGCVVPDIKLRCEINELVMRIVISRYEEFYERFGGNLVKFKPEDVRSCLSRLYGSAGLRSDSDFSASFRFQIGEH